MSAPDLRRVAEALRRHATWLSHALASDAVVGVADRAEACRALVEFRAVADILADAAPVPAALSPAESSRDLVALFRLDRLPPHPPGACAT